MASRNSGFTQKKWGDFPVRNMSAKTGGFFSQFGVDSICNFPKWQFQGLNPPFSSMWGPRSIAKLVQITPINMVYGTYNELVTEAYKPTYNWGASPCWFNLLHGWCSQFWVASIASFVAWIAIWVG
jgi:hypothetical protein